MKILDKEKAKKVKVIVRLSNGEIVKVPLVGYEKILEEMEAEIQKKRN